MIIQWGAERVNRGYHGIACGWNWINAISAAEASKVLILLVELRKQYLTAMEARKQYTMATDMRKQYTMTTDTRKQYKMTVSLKGGD